MGPSPEMHAIGDVMDPVAGEHTLTTFALSILGFGLLLSGIVILGVVSDRSQSTPTVLAPA